MSDLRHILPSDDASITSAIKHEREMLTCFTKLIFYLVMIRYNITLNDCGLAELKEMELAFLSVERAMHSACGNSKS